MNSEGIIAGLIVALIVIIALALLAASEISALNRSIKNSGYKTERTYDQKTGSPIDRLVKDDAVEKFGGGQ